MRIKAWTCVLAVVLLLACVLATWAGGLWWKQRHWLDLQHRQLAAIERIGEFSPSGWKRDSGENAVVTLYDVWGNVAYHPDYSMITAEGGSAKVVQLNVSELNSIWP